MFSDNYIPVLQQYNTPKAALALAVTLALMSSFASAQEETEAKVFETIEVTSQKRVQNVMKVPVTVGIVDAELLEQSTSISLGDIDRFIPGFRLEDNGVTQAGIEIRGIASPNISVGGDPSSATFYDDVYMPRAAQNVLFTDIERIEVLKGPQGTLFGRNAAMGVVNIIPRAPNDYQEGFAKVTLGTDNLVRLEGMINQPITDSLYVRANLLSNQQDGFVENLSTPSWNSENGNWDLGERDHKAARIALLWDISEVTQFQLSYDYDDLHQAPPMAIGLSEFAYNGGTDVFASQAENDVRDGLEARDMYALTAKLEHTFDEHWSGKYVASYREWETINREDEDGTGQIRRYFDTSNNEDSSIFYTELQLNYSSEKTNAVMGFSYSKEDVAQTTELNVTADTIAVLTTGALNEQIRGVVAQELAAAIGGDSDALAEAVFGPGVTFDAAVDLTYSDAGFPLDHIWNSDEWAGALTALGFAEPLLAALGMSGVPLTGELVSALGDTTYDLVAAQLGIPEIFGPSFSGQFWQESINNTGDFTNWGVFADIDYAISDKWHIIAGLRYSKDDKDFTWFIPPTTFAEVRPGVTNQLFPQVDLSASDSWSKVTGRLVTNYQLTDRQMFFASYSTGYKSGGFDSLVPISQQDGQSGFAPEDTENLEFGYKAVLWDSVKANVSYYLTSLDNFQVAVESKPPGASTAVPSIINENREIKGLELDVQWSVTDGLILSFLSEIRDTDADSPTFYNAQGDVQEAQTRNYDTTNYTLAADWVFDVPVGYVTAHVDYAFAENTNDQLPDILPFERDVPTYLDDRKNLNVRLALMNEEETMEVSLWARNLTDERYVEHIRKITNDTLGTPYARINRGREVGVEFKYSF